MARYIDADKVLNDLPDDLPYKASVKRVLIQAPTADVVEIDKVAEMFAEQFGDECPCNFNGIDEWLPYVCDYTKTNDCPCEGKEGWMQFIKHYGKRKESE